MPRRLLYTLACIVLAAAAFAQPPSGSILWLRSDAGVTTNVDTVMQWEDQSGIGNSAFQNTSANAPHLVPNVVNGLPVVRFDGATSYMEAPSVFPVSHDYTLSLVVKINNYGATNNIVSGTTHAHWLGGARYPRVLHGDFNNQAVSSIAMNDGACIITFVYTEGSKNAIVYVNGQFADSAFTGANTDPTLFLGAYQRGNLMNGDLAEVLLYPRRLTPADQAATESYFFTKYAIPKPPPLPIPDSTFIEHPATAQLYPRGADDSATVKINGVLRRTNFDSIYCTVMKNAVVQKRTAVKLVYQSGAARFGFAVPIHAELSEYKFIVGIKRPGKDTVLAVWDSVVCGDVFLACGQSNSIFGAPGIPKGEFCRTFGINFSSSARDTLWGLSDGTSYGGGQSVGAWVMRVQKLIQDSLGIPTCVIAGGVGGTTIEQHQRDATNPENRSTIYGSMLYRVHKAGVASAAKGMFWYQGESNQMTAAVHDYPQLFRTLFNDWNRDYPNLAHYFLVQIHPGCAAGPHSVLREFQRECIDSFPNTTVMSVMGVPGHDGCHFTAQGYITQGDNMYRVVHAVYYQRPADSTPDNITPPNIERAFYTSKGHDKIALVFRERNAGITWPEDTLVGGVSHNLAEAFYLDTTSLHVESGWIVGDTVMLKLISPSNAKTITYLPDQNYVGTATVYEGPWLLNKRGLGALSFANIPITERPPRVGIRAGREQDLPMSIAIRGEQNGGQEIMYTIPQAGRTRIDMFDMRGRNILTVRDAYTDAGAHSVAMPLRTPGVYFCRLTLGAASRTVPCIVVR